MAAGAATVYYLYDLNRARRAHQVHGGVLLDFGEMYLVCDFEDAVELRADDFNDPFDQARYWAVMGECGYDETELPVQRIKACLLRREHEVLVEGNLRPGTCPN